MVRCFLQDRDKLAVFGREVAHTGLNKQPPVSEGKESQRDKEDFLCFQYKGRESLFFCCKLTLLFFPGGRGGVQLSGEKFDGSQETSSKKSPSKRAMKQGTLLDWSKKLINIRRKVQEKREKNLRAAINTSSYALKSCSCCMRKKWGWTGEIAL